MATPSLNEPPDSVSRTTDRSAIWMGLCSGRTLMFVTRFMSSVTADSAPSMTNGAGIHPSGRKWCSATEKVSYPSGSAVCACSSVA